MKKMKKLLYLVFLTLLFIFVWNINIVFGLPGSGKLHVCNGTHGKFEIIIPFVNCTIDNNYMEHGEAYYQQCCCPPPYDCYAQCEGDDDVFMWDDAIHSFFNYGYPYLDCVKNEPLYVDIVDGSLEIIDLGDDYVKVQANIKIGGIYSIDRNPDFFKIVYDYQLRNTISVDTGQTISGENIRYQHTNFVPPSEMDAWNGSFEPHDYAETNTYDLTLSGLSPNTTYSLTWKADSEIDGNDNIDYESIGFTTDVGEPPSFCNDVCSDECGEGLVCVYIEGEGNRCRNPECTSVSTTCICGQCNDACPIAKLFKILVHWGIDLDQYIDTNQIVNQMCV